MGYSGGGGGGGGGYQIIQSSLSDSFQVLKTATSISHSHHHCMAGDDVNCSSTYLDLENYMTPVLCLNKEKKIIL